ncbi:unnamed protein product, partial [Symbiodinium pilosum]
SAAQEADSLERKRRGSPGISPGCSFEADAPSAQLAAHFASPGGPSSGCSSALGCWQVSPEAAQLRSI